MLRVGDEIKARLNITDVVSGYISLKRAGASFKAACPFHQEKTASFFVSPEKQIWHCFGCNEGGDIFSFVMKMEGLEFIEALKLLAQKAGVALPEFQATPEKRAGESERAKLLKITALAAAYFKKYLRESPAAAEARDYLACRKISLELQDEFHLGYAPDSWDSLLQFLRGRKYTDAEITRAGLAIKNDRGGIYDRFRKRIIFPIQDISCHVVGFTGRLMPEDEKKENAGGKYMNTPETELYHKGRVLYGLDKAKQAIRAADEVVITEGNMDVIAVYGAGTKNVVASSGTALTAEQLALLKRFTSNIILSFDADFAGESAARRGLSLAWGAGMNVRALTLPPEAGKDPDDCVRKDPALWRRALREARPIVEHLFERAIKGRDLKSAEGKRLAAADFLGVLAELKDPIERDHWLKKLAEVLNIREEAAREALKNFLAKTTPESRQRPAGGVLKPAVSEGTPFALLGKELLALLLVTPEFLPFIGERLEPSDFIDERTSALYSAFVTHYNTNGRNLNFADFYRWLSQKESRSVISFFEEIIFLAEKNGKRPVKEARNEILKCMRRLIGIKIQRERFSLETEMRRAEETNDQAQIGFLIQKFQELLKKEKFYEE